MIKKRLTEEMFSRIDLALLTHKDFLLKIACRNKKIDVAEYIDDLPDSDLYSHISLFVLFNYRDNIERLFESSNYKITVPFFTLTVKYLYNAFQFTQKMNYLEIIHYDISRTKQDNSIDDKKVINKIDEIYKLSKDVAESEAQYNLEQIAKLITAIESTDLDMTALYRCKQIRDEVYLIKALQSLYFHIKMEMDSYPGINDFKFVEYDDDGLYIVDADNLPEYIELFYFSDVHDLFKNEEE